MRDFIEVVFVKKRFYSADAPVPSSLGRLPVRPHLDYNVTLLTDLLAAWNSGAANLRKLTQVMYCLQSTSSSIARSSASREAEMPVSSQRLGLLCALPRCHRSCCAAPPAGRFLGWRRQCSHVFFLIGFMQCQLSTLRAPAGCAAARAPGRRQQPD